AVRLLADGVEALAADLRLQPPVGRAAGRRNLQPGGLAGAAERNRPVGLGRGAARLRPRAGHMDLVGVCDRITHAIPSLALSSPSAAGSVATGRRSKTSQKCEVSDLANVGRSCLTPSSRVSEVTWQPSIPQGTIHSNGCRSLLTFTARPWVVTPRLTW